VKFNEKEIVDKKEKYVIKMKNDFLFIKSNRGKDGETQKNYLDTKRHENFFNRESRESSRILKVPE
jgi:hypothetical protein